MGKAAVELPELAEASAEPGPAGTDDLLAQLAGQEIDRLLAEADLDRPPATAPAATATPTALLEPIAEVTAEAPPPPAAVAPITGPPPEAQEKLLPDLDAPRAEGAIGELIGPLDLELEEATRETSASAERLGLDLALGPAAAQLAADDAGGEYQSDEVTLPAILKPLEWLDACFDAIPENLLEVAGKIGILTMVNAIAVLLYVLFFRHR